jgi:hypothetical protein
MVFLFYEPGNKLRLRCLKWRPRSLLSSPLVERANEGAKRESSCGEARGEGGGGGKEAGERLS